MIFIESFTTPTEDFQEINKNQDRAIFELDQNFAKLEESFDNIKKEQELSKTNLEKLRLSIAENANQDSFFSTSSKSCIKLNCFKSKIFIMFEIYDLTA